MKNYYDHLDCFEESIALAYTEDIKEAEHLKKFKLLMLDSPDEYYDVETSMKNEKAEKVLRSAVHQVMTNTSRPVPKGGYGYIDQGIFFNRKKTGSSSSSKEEKQPTVKASFFGARPVVQISICLLNSNQKDLVGVFEKNNNNDFLTRLAGAITKNYDPSATVCYSAKVEPTTVFYTYINLDVNGILVHMDWAANDLPGDSGQMLTNMITISLKEAGYNLMGGLTNGSGALSTDDEWSVIVPLSKEVGLQALIHPQDAMVPFKLRFGSTTMVYIHAFQSIAEKLKETADEDPTLMDEFDFRKEQRIFYDSRIKQGEFEAYFGVAPSENRKGYLIEEPSRQWERSHQITYQQIMTLIKRVMEKIPYHGTVPKKNRT
eukprot:Platyproteum_vivax@DN1802_c0_g1_i1.p1